MSEQPAATKLGSFATVTKLTPVVLTALLLASCGNVLQVTRQKAPLPPAPDKTACDNDDDQCKLPGVPFYVVGYRCTHSTSWLRPLYVVTVAVTTENDGKIVKAITRILGMEGFKKAGNAIVAIKNAGSVTKEEYDRFLKDLTDVPESDLSICKPLPMPSRFEPAHLPVQGTCEAENAVLASNQVVPERYVDARTVYFQNVKRPWTGSASSEVDLSNEGILSKSSAQIVDKTLETILTTIGTLGGAALGGSAAPMTPAAAGTKDYGGAEAPAKFKLDLQIQTKLYRYTLAAPQCVNGQTCDSATSNGTSGYVLPPCNPVSKLVGESGGQFNSTFEEITLGATSGDGAAKPGKETANKPKQ